MNFTRSVPPRFDRSESEFSDMTVGLIFFGSLTLVMGALMLLLAPISILAAGPAARAGGIPVNWGQAIGNALTFAALGFTLLSLGYGSIRRRRWARVLLGIVSWTWLLLVVLLLALLFAYLKEIAQAVVGMMPQARGNNSSMAAVMVHVSLFRGLVFSTPFIVGIPSLWVWFYTNRSVRLTCERADPGGGWTDQCPPSVLAVSVWLAVSVPLLIVSALTHHGAFPFFGIQLSGFLGGLMSFALAGIWAYAAWATYRLRPAGWWVTTISFMVMFLSSWLTWARGDLSEMLQAAGVSPEQVRQMEPAMALIRPMMSWATLLFQIPILGSMLWVRRYFFARSESR